MPPAKNIARDVSPPPPRCRPASRRPPLHPLPSAPGWTHCRGERRWPAQGFSWRRPSSSSRAEYEWVNQWMGPIRAQGLKEDIEKWVDRPFHIQTIRLHIKMSALFWRKKLSHCSLQSILLFFNNQSILLFTNIDVSRHILVVDISVLTKSNMGRREYCYFFMFAKTHCLIISLSFIYN
jgi:hypothetical protein